MLTVIDSQKDANYNKWYFKIKPVVIMYYILNRLQNNLVATRYFHGEISKAFQIASNKLHFRRNCNYNYLLLRLEYNNYNMFTFSAMKSNVVTSDYFNNYDHNCNRKAIIVILLY